MKEITFSIDSSIFEKHQNYRRGIVIAKDVVNEGDLSEEVLQRVDMIKELDLQDARLVAWREAFAREGIKARDFRPSIDALARRAIAGKPFGSINPIVDIGTIVSLEFVVPAGAHPILPSTKRVDLTRAHGDENDVAPDGKEEIIPQGEIILKDTDRPAARRWVWRQTPLSRIHQDTSAFFLNIDALDSMSDEELQKSIALTEELILGAFGVEAMHFVLDRDQPEMQIAL